MTDSPKAAATNVGSGGTVSLVQPRPCVFALAYLGEECFSTDPLPASNFAKFEGTDPPPRMPFEARLTSGLRIEKLGAAFMIWAPRGARSMTDLIVVVVNPDGTNIVVDQFDPLDPQAVPFNASLTKGKEFLPDPRIEYVYYWSRDHDYANHMWTCLSSWVFNGMPLKDYLTKPPFLPASFAAPIELPPAAPGAELSATWAERIDGERTSHQKRVSADLQHLLAEVSLTREYDTEGRAYPFTRASVGALLLYALVRRHARAIMRSETLATETCAVSGAALAVAWEKVRSESLPYLEKDRVYFFVTLPSLAMRDYVRLILREGGRRMRNALWSANIFGFAVAMTECAKAGAESGMRVSAPFEELRQYCVETSRPGATDAEVEMRAHSFAQAAHRIVDRKVAESGRKLAQGDFVSGDFRDIEEALEQAAALHVDRLVDDDKARTLRAKRLDAVRQYGSAIALGHLLRHLKVSAVLPSAPSDERSIVDLISTHQAEQERMICDVYLALHSWIVRAYKPEDSLEDMARRDPWAAQMWRPRAVHPDDADQGKPDDPEGCELAMIVGDLLGQLRVTIADIPESNANYMGMFAKVWKGGKEASKAAYKAGDWYYAALLRRVGKSDALMRALGNRDVQLRLGEHSLHWTTSEQIHAGALGWWKRFISGSKLDASLELIHQDAIKAAVADAIEAGHELQFKAEGHVHIQVIHRAMTAKGTTTLTAALKAKSMLPKKFAAFVESANALYTMITVAKMLSERNNPGLRQAEQVDVTLTAATAGIKLVYQGAALADKFVALYSAAAHEKALKALANAKVRASGWRLLGGSTSAEAGLVAAKRGMDNARILRFVLPQAARGLNAASCAADAIYAIVDPNSELNRAAARNDSTLIWAHGADIGIKGLMAVVAVGELMGGAGMIAASTAAMWFPPAWIALCTGSVVATVLINYYEAECRGLYEAFQRAVRTEFRVGAGAKVVPSSRMHGRRYFRDDVLLAGR